MDEVDKRRVRRAKMMEEFSQTRKQHIITSALAVFLGMFGAHRIYLGHYHIAAGIFVLVLLTAITAIKGIEGAVIGLILILVFEIFYATYATDKWNNKLKKTLEEKYKV